MIEQIKSHITWKKLRKLDGLSLTDTFEELCAQYIQVENSLKIPLPIGASNYPGTEGNYISGERGNYGFQAKFGKEPFSKAEIIDSISKIDNGTDILFICTKEEYPHAPRSKKKLFDKNKICKNKDDWDDYTQLLKDSGKFKEVIFLHGDEFLKNIKRHSDLIYKYFPVPEILKEIYAAFETVSEKDKRIIDKILDVKNGFDGNYNLYKKDLKLAELFQRKYLVQKYGYSNMSYVLDRYGEMEDEIFNEIYQILELLDYEDLNDFLSQASNQLDDLKSIRRNYGSEFSDMISTEQGLFVNYGTESKSFLNYTLEEGVKFKKR